MVYDWGAMSARQDRARDRDRGQSKKRADIVRGTKKYKFRKKKGSKFRLHDRDEAQLVITRAKRVADARKFSGRGGIQPAPASDLPVELPGGQSVQAFVGMETLGRKMIDLPLPGGGVAQVGRRVGVGLLRNLPGIGRYLGNTQAGVGRYLGQQSQTLRRALPWLAGVSGGVALEKIADWGLERMGEGSMYPTSQMPGRKQIAPGIPGSGGTSLMQQSPLGTLSRGQEFPGGPFVVKTWDTYPGPGVTGGGAWPIFALLSDGRIVVSKPNGSWKVYRPKKNLVISSNPRLRDIRKLDRMHKRVVKMVRRIVPPTRRK